MQRNRKISLLAISLALAFVLLSASPQAAFETGVQSFKMQEEFSPSAALAPQIVAYWQLNEDGGVDVHDNVTPFVHGETIGNPNPMWVPGVVGSCLELLDNQYVEFNDPFRYLNLPEIVSIEAWVNLPDPAGHHTILMNSFDPATTQYHFAIRDGRLFFEQQLGSPREVMSHFSINPGQWHHVAVVYYRSANRVWFYIDGNEESQSFPAIYISAPGEVVMGRNMYDLGYLNGLIDEVAVYSTTLDLATIIEHYEKGILGLGYFEVINTPPVAEDDYYVTDEDTPLIVSAPGVLANDRDDDEEPIGAVIEIAPAFGTVTLLLDGGFTYIPNPDTSGIDSFTYRAIDTEDESNIATVTIEVLPDDDRTGPVITILYTGDSTDANPGSWEVSVVDPESGVETISVEIDGTDVGSTEGIYAVPGTLGDHTIMVTATNADLDTGPQDQETSMRSDTVTIIDVTPPETTIGLSGTMGLNNWYVSDVTVTLTVSEIATTAYTINGGPWMVYSGPFTVALEGQVTISYNSTDTSGHRETTKTTSYQVDKTPPVIKLTPTPVPGEGILVTLTATETGSGLIDVGYNINGGRWLRYGGPVLLTQEGLVTFNYRAKDFAGNLVEKVKIIDVVIPPDILPPELTYTGALTGVYSDIAYLEARLMDVLTGVPIPGKWIVFTLGSMAMEAMTDIDGIASYILVLDLSSGDYSLTASFAGDEDYTGISVTNEFFVSKEFAYAEYTGRTVIPTSDETLTLMATIFDEVDGYWGDLARIYVTFSLYLGTDLVFETEPIQVMTTDVQGVGLAISEIENLDEGDYLVVVRFNSLDNSYYYGPETETTANIYVPEREFAHGAGFIRDEEGRRIYFVFTVRYSCKGKLKGFLFLTYRVNEWIYFISSREILSLTVDEQHGVFEAEGRLSQINFKAHQKICTDEVYRFRVDVWDNKDSDDYEDDVFQIKVYDLIGLVDYEVGFDPLGLLVRGNIKVKEHH